MRTMLAASRPAARRSLSVLFLGSLLAAGVRAQSEEQISLPPEENQRFLVCAGGGSGDPGTDWSYREVLGAGLGLRTIMPIDNAAQSGRVQDVLRMAHLLLPVTVLNSSGQIGTWLANGTLYGVEFDVFSDDPQAKPAVSERLGTDGLILGLDESQRSLLHGVCLLKVAAGDTNPHGERSPRWGKWNVVQRSSNGKPARPQ